MSNDDFEFGSSGYQPAQSANITFGEDAVASSPNAPIKDISTAEFPIEVIEASKNTPVLVDFWAPWCGPCKQLAPALEAAVAATNGKVKLVKMDIDQNPEIPGQMGIQSIPAVVAFVDGRPADAFMGAKPESEIREFIAKIAGPDPQDTEIEQLLEHASNLVSEGAVGEAGNIYGQILSAQPDNLKAIAAVGQLYLAESNFEGAKGVTAALSEEQLSNPEIVSLLTAVELAEQAGSLGDTAQLEAEVAAAPDDHQKRMDFALALNAAGKNEEAADQLLEIMKRQPGWNEDAAKTQLLQFFEAWGLTDPVTVSARRRLSSLLFS